ncbi:amino acid adenylation domain-containing protein [Streptomyces sp. BE147]|uniref:amino acid adenylation domain-containing protein n=1 Tax=Streptomyces sp. BE147 TaxID=3002524 RepID=UPI002E792C5A|nr:amino acid adenylation domain-containing protein [Streptomyces sp. BE147]MEE1737875.1 amino acid adenylation domain-containing protein [Streptomyces sp. BE147]
MSLEHRMRIPSKDEIRGDTARTLGIAAEDIGDHDDLIALGLTSLQTQMLAVRWGGDGTAIGLGDLGGAATVDSWWHLISSWATQQGTEQDRLSDGMDLRAPFELTPMQQSYWVGRAPDMPLGGVGCHIYLEFDSAGIDPTRLRNAIRALTLRHSMLRARFLPDGRQQINDTARWSELTVHDLRTHSPRKLQGSLAELRETLSQRRLDVEHGEVFDLQLSQLPEGRARLHCDFDLLVVDGRSVQVILDDLSRHYSDPDSPLPPLGYEFPQYLADRRARATERRTDEEYWKNQLGALPGAPALPLAQAPEHVSSPRFRRWTHEMDDQQWTRFTVNARRHGVTPALALATAYAEVLARWSSEPSFLLNLPNFGRRITHSAVPHMVGDFSNLVLLPFDFSQHIPFVDRTAAAQHTFRANLAHSDYYGVEVLRDLARVRPGTAAPVVFTYNVFDAYGDDLVSPHFRANLGELTYMITQTPQVWLDHQVFSRDTRTVLVWDAVDDLFEQGVIEDAFASYISLVEMLAEDESAWTRSAEIPLPRHHQRARALVVDDRTHTHPSESLLHTRFFRRAMEEPARAALLSSDQAPISYGQLADTALRIATALTEAGVTPAEAVAVISPRGEGEVAAVLGILAAGASYVAVAADATPDRQRQLLQQAGVRLALTADSILDLPVWEGRTHVLALSQASVFEPLCHPAEPSPDSLAYLIYTSGSTGTPKAVEVPHRAAANTVDWVNRHCGVGAEDRLLSLTALDFDLSVYDIFGPLSVGGAVVVVPEAQRRDPDAWWELLKLHRVSLWNSVPLLFDTLLAAHPTRRLPGSLRRVLLSGDWIPLDLPAQLDRAGRGTVRLLALGGPTETAIWSNAFEVERTEPHWASIPYGFPLQNQYHRVVDAHGQDCPDWVPGELWVGGTCLANGYRGDPQRTAERFVRFEGGRWYRTGDLVRYRTGGVLEILGRMDLQVKINGHRIELGAIDSHLARDPLVAKSVTVAGGTRGNRRLTTFLVPNQEAVDLDRVRSELVRHLPSHEVPSRFLVIDELPLTSNGKTDRNTLTAWASATPQASFGSPEPLRIGTEQDIADAWSRVLSQPVNRRGDNFFDLGGNSLLATLLIRSLGAQLNIPLTARELYAAPTIAELAELVSGRISRRLTSATGEDTEDAQDQ